MVTLGLLPLFFNLITSGVQTATEASMQQQGNEALSIITNQVARSKSIVSTTYPVDTELPAPSSGWSGSDSVLVLEQIATTLAPQNPNRKPVSYAPLVFFGCSLLKLDVNVYYVYYIHERILYQRTVSMTVPEGSFCDGATSVHQKTSCLTCSDKPKDVILARNVESFTIGYTPEDTGVTNPYVSTDVIRMSLTLKTDNYQYTSTSSARLLLAGSS